MEATSFSTRPPLGDDEKATAVMVYTDSFLYWGEVTTKAVIRVSTWLRTNTAPDYLCLYNAMALLPGASTNPKPVRFPEMHIPAAKVIGFHMLPPAADPLDYDPNEANRKLEPVVALVGQFRMDASMRMATKSDLKRYLEVSRETFSTLYDVTISHPGIAYLNLPKIAFVLVRQAATTFAHNGLPAG